MPKPEVRGTLLGHEQDRLLVFACDVLRTVQFCLLEALSRVHFLIRFSTPEQPLLERSRSRRRVQKKGPRRRDFIAKIVHNATRNALANKLRSGADSNLGH
jgi:hypothetical protein